jgi:hypothetical protein
MEAKPTVKVFYKGKVPVKKIKTVKILKKFGK